jgi:hypothetical protein
MQITERSVDCQPQLKSGSKDPYYYFLFWWDWNLNSELCTYKAGVHKSGTELLETHLQSILLWIFLEKGSPTICLGWPGIKIHPISASQVARNTGMSHWCPVCKDLFKDMEKSVS